VAVRRRPKRRPREPHRRWTERRTLRPPSGERRRGTECSTRCASPRTERLPRSLLATPQSVSALAAVPLTPSNARITSRVIARRRRDTEETRPAVVRRQRAVAYSAREPRHRARGDTTPGALHARRFPTHRAAHALSARYTPECARPRRRSLSDPLECSNYVKGDSETKERHTQESRGRRAATAHRRVRPECFAGGASPRTPTREKSSTRALCSLHPRVRPRGGL